MGAGAGTRTEEVYQAVLKDLLARAHRTRSRGIAKSAPPPNHGPGACRCRQLATHCPLGGLDNPPMISGPPWESRPRAALCSKIRRQPRVLVPCPWNSLAAGNLSVSRRRRAARAAVAKAVKEKVEQPAGLIALFGLSSD